MSREIGKVSPDAIQWKVWLDLVREPVDHERWAALERVPFRDTEKYRSVVQRFVDGRAWEQTPLFRQMYQARFAAGESIRGCLTMGALLNHYHHRFDAIFEDMQASGYRQEIDGLKTTPIPVYLAGDGQLLVGNQGNHRLAMAQILRLPFVIVQVVGRHPASNPLDLDPAPQIVEAPIRLPVCAQAIPAMTSDEERRCYYQLARDAAASGVVVELGVWLGAATAYLAAGVRDSGCSSTVHVFDRFIWKPRSHDKKAGGPLKTSQLEAFRRNLGDLLPYVSVHAIDLSALTWDRQPISLLVCDLPKRIPQISAVLSTFADAIQPGTMMAWQDFGYFPAYDIPAAFVALGDHVEFIEAIYPGTAAIFRVTRPWTREHVSLKALSLAQWTPADVESAWDAWAERLPVGMRPRFAVGAAMFLCDLGAVTLAQRRLREILRQHEDAVLPKLRYLVEELPGLMRRYQPLIEVMASCA